VNFLNNVTYFMVKRVNGYIRKLYSVHEDRTFTEVETLLFVLDGALENPYSVSINEKESSIVINDSYGILFEDDLSMEIFMEEFFFLMEELNGVEDEFRYSSPERDINDVEAMLDNLSDLQANRYEEYLKEKSEQINKSGEE